MKLEGGYVEGSCKYIKSSPLKKSYCAFWGFAFPLLCYVTFLWAEMSHSVPKTDCHNVKRDTAAIWEK